MFVRSFSHLLELPSLRDSIYDFDRLRYCFLAVNGAVLEKERTMLRNVSTKGILERLNVGTVIGAEGYVFELERRGYIKAGPYVPEVVLDFPEAVKELHREFLRAGSEVMVAL